MIRALLLVNFQRHKKKVFRLGRITSITGPTDSGKSAIIRALKWAALNTRGHFTRNGQTRSVVAIRTGKAEVKRVRKGSESSYQINGKAFKALGTETPAQLRSVLALSELNFQGQHDAPFWFSSSPGEVSRQLNQIVNLGVIDDVLARVGGRLRKAKTVEEVCADRLKEAREKSKELEWVVEFDVDLKRIEELHTELAQEKEVYSSIARDIREAHELSQFADVELPDFTETDQMASDILVARGHHKILHELINSAEFAQKRETDAQQQAELAKSELVKRTNGVCPICGKKL